MITPNGYFCRICHAPLTGQRRQLCGSRDCQNTARHELRARFAPGGARGRVGRPIFYYRVIKDNPYWPVGRVFAAPLIKADIRSGLVTPDCFTAYQEAR